MLVVTRLYDWSFAQTEYFVNDSLVLRQFCRVYLEKVPDDTTLIRWAKPIGPATLERLNERAVALARSRQVTRGRKLRVDTTVIETNLHHPSEGALLGNGVRVLSRLLRRAKPVLGEQAASLGRDAFRSRMRTVRKLAQAMYRTARRKGEERIEALKQSYGRLIDTAQRTQAQAERVHQMLQRTPAPQGYPAGKAVGATAPGIQTSVGPRHSASVAAGDRRRSSSGQRKVALPLRAADADHPPA